MASIFHALPFCFFGCLYVSYWAYKICPSPSHIFHSLQYLQLLPVPWFVMLAVFLSMLPPATFPPFLLMHFLASSLFLSIFSIPLNILFISFLSFLSKSCGRCLDSQLDKQTFLYIPYALLSFLFIPLNFPLYSSQFSLWFSLCTSQFPLQILWQTPSISITQKTGRTHRRFLFLFTGCDKLLNTIVSQVSSFNLWRNDAQWNISRTGNNAGNKIKCLPAR